MQLPAANISNETAMPIGERDKKLIDAFPEAICSSKSKGRILSANRTALELFGCHLDRLAGRDLSILVTDDSSQLKLYLHACSRAAQFHIGSFQLRGDSGQQITCRFDGALSLGLRGCTDFSATSIQNR